MCFRIQIVGYQTYCIVTEPSCLRQGKKMKRTTECKKSNDYMSHQDKTNFMLHLKL